MNDRNDPIDDPHPSLLAAGYALGSLTLEEIAAYEAFLAGSPDARIDAAAYEQTAVALGLDAAPVEPRPELKANLMALIQTTPQEAPAGNPSHAAPAASVTTTPVLADRPAAPHAAVDENVVDPGGTTGRRSAAQTKARTRWFTRPVAVLTAAAAAAALFFGGALVGQSLGSTPAPEVQQASALAQITSASDAQRASAAVTDGGTATLVWSLELGKSAILVDGLGALPADKTYELWYMRGDAAHPAGTMDASGTVTWRVLEGTMQAGDTVGITVEPAGGSSQPTTTPLVAIAS